LILPTIVDVGNSATINVRPRRTIADRCIVADVDLTNIHRSVVDQSITRAIADVRPVSVSNVWTIAICDPIAHTWTRRPRKRGWFERPVHSQEVTKITG
jgi:hypothetical protein